MNEAILTHDEAYPSGWRVIACLLMAGLADLLFYNEGLGWTAGFFTFVILSTLLFFNPSLVLTRPNKVIIAINFVWVLALIENPSGLTLTLAFLGVTTIALLSHPGWIHNAGLWLRGILDFWTQNVLKVFMDLKFIKYLFQSENHRSRSSIQLKNWILPLGLSLVFVFLFAGANPVLIRWLDLVNWNWIVDFLTLERILLWSLAITLSWPLLRPKFRLKQHFPESEFSRKAHAVIHYLFSTDSILYSLILFNILFSIQTLMDIIYLWGGATLPENMSYAEYAHRGAYPLIATALLAGGFVLVALRPGSETDKIPFIRYLVYFWIGQNVFLVISSIWRTTLYIEEYSLTYLRLSAMIWMGLVALGLVWLVLRILWSRSNTWMINLNGFTLLAVLMICAFINLGGVIARFNVEHCKEVRGRGPALDLQYLKEIGLASLPALHWYQQHGHQNNYTMSRVLKLDRDLQHSLGQELEDWRTWTFRKYRLALQADAGKKLRTSIGSSGWRIAPNKNGFR
ncbi:MAG: DUF4173 domain-containing protein [Nitrospinota bacterium]|nr:DUF4173 domain-containing protein [Nitrospinota bacterium]